MILFNNYTVNIINYVLNFYKITKQFTGMILLFYEKTVQSQ